MMTDEDIKRGMPFFEREDEREAWRREQGYSVMQSPEPCNRIPLPSELPPLATVGELRAQQPPEFLKNDGWFDIDVSKFYMDFTEAWQPPEYTLSYKGVMFAPLQGICGISGQAPDVQKRYQPDQKNQQQHEHRTC